MAKWMPCKRRDFTKKLRKLGFEPPEPGGHYHYRDFEELSKKDLEKMSNCRDTLIIGAVGVTYL